MTSKGFQNKPFDDGTIIKLEVFREYLKSWLPTFIRGKKIYWQDIFIFDFFAGEGKDIEGNYGSALIILEELKQHHDAIINKNLNVHVLFNDIDKDKITRLEKLIDEVEPEPPYNISLERKDFNILFEELYPLMKNSADNPRLIFIDQYGIKHVTRKLFLKLVDLKRTDFIFFISSSFVRRFSELDEFNKYLEIEKESFEESRPFHSHLVVSEYYKSLIPENKEYFLAPFSIQKNANIFGLIFGSSHSFGIEKFLHIGWKINPITGNANYNIDEESIATGQLSIFQKDNKPKKLQLFEHILETKILNHEIRTNKQIYSFTFYFGCLPKHANTVITKLVEEKKIKSIKTSSQIIHKLEEEVIKVLK